MSWPYFRKHVVRTILTTAGIVLGVSVFVAMHTANQSVLFAFSQTVDRIAGKTELEVTAGDAGFNEDVLDRVQSASTVRIAVPVIEAIVDSNIKGQGSLLVLGIDMTGDRSLREYELESGEEAIVDDPLVFPRAARFPHPFQRFRRQERGASQSRLHLGTVEGDRAFTVRGIMKSSELTSAFGGNLAIMDVYAAQKMFGARPHLRPHRSCGEARNHARRMPARAQLAARAGVRDTPAGGTRPAVRGGARRILDDGEHLQRVRAAHRDVHHLQFVRSRRTSAAR
jgi:putative ABC transport system permease protein